MSRHGNAAQRTAVLESVGILLRQWRALPGSVLPYLAGDLTAIRSSFLACMRRLGDFGPLASAAEPRLRELLDNYFESWVPTEAAYALWRTTGDTETAVRGLTWIIPHLLDGWCTPAAVLALNHPASIAHSTPDVTAAARFVLASPLRLTNSGGWRAFTDDEQSRRPQPNT